jgi:hypothetical protein
MGIQVLKINKTTITTREVTTSRIRGNSLITQTMQILQLLQTIQTSNNRLGGRVETITIVVMGKTAAQIFKRETKAYRLLTTLNNLHRFRMKLPNKLQLR